MTRSRAISILLAASLALPLPRLALADGDTSALADSLFEEGKKLMDVDHDYAHACPKLAESHRLRPGGGTVLRLALCYEAWGKAASAHARFREAIAMAVKDKREDRRQQAEVGLARVEPHMSYLVIEVPKELDVPGLVVRLDGSPIERPAFGAKLAVDAGTHALHAEAPGKKPFDADVDVKPDGDSVIAKVAPLVDLPKPPEPPTTTTTTTTIVDDDHAGRKTTAYVVGAAGIVALGVGAFLGIEALRTNKQAKDLCGGDPCRSDEGAAKSRDALHYGNASTIVLGVGVIAVATSAVLLLTIPSTSERRATTPALTFGSDGRSGVLALQGAF